MLYNVLIAVAVVSGIGLVCGIVLALASHFMAVKTDEKKKPSATVCPESTAAHADIRAVTDTRRLSPKAKQR